MMAADRSAEEQNPELNAFRVHHCAPGFRHLAAINRDGWRRREAEADLAAFTSRIATSIFESMTTVSPGPRADSRAAAEARYRLRERMEKRGFKPSDPLYEKVATAYDAVFRLWVDLHYLSCGVKNPSGAEKPP